MLFVRLYRTKAFNFIPQSPPYPSLWDFLSNLYRLPFYSTFPIIPENSLLGRRDTMTEASFIKDDVKSGLAYVRRDLVCDHHGGKHGRVHAPTVLQKELSSTS